MSFNAILRSSLHNTFKSLSRFPFGYQQNNMHRMSLVPYLMRELLQDLERPSLYDQHFGMGLSPLLQPSFYIRPWRIPESGVSNIVHDKDGFKVNLDVQQFKPEELNVKVVDNYVVIEGKHEERSDAHGYVSRHFTRRYKLPDDINIQALQSSLSSDGVLQLTAPKKPDAETGARSIPITQTNTPAVKGAESKQQGQEKPE